MIGSHFTKSLATVRGCALHGALVAFMLIPHMALAQAPRPELTAAEAAQVTPELLQLVEAVGLSLMEKSCGLGKKCEFLAPKDGAAHSTLLRVAAPDYGDGISSLAGQSRLSAREISNIVLSQPRPVPSGKKASDLVWQWGQFIDHDIDLTEGHNPPEAANISVPTGDPFFDPSSTGTAVIGFNRSIYDPATGTDPSNPRQQINEISALIDGTNIYGEDPARTQALRTLDGTGRLKTSPGGFLPYNVDGFPNAQPDGADPADFFLSGDVRANEQLGLTVMHTLWMREHNRCANAVRLMFPHLSGDEVFEVARATVVAEVQAITYSEFLPVLLGKNALDSYTGYDPSVDPGIANVFSTALYRLGHTMLSSTILRLDPNGNPIPEGHLPLRDAFFTPDTLINEGGLEPILKGQASQVMQRIDSMVVDDIRNFLFGPPGAGGFDLASLNIQRGRDHGLPDYNTFRIAYGLTPVLSFADISSDPVVQNRLATAYTNVNDIDVWVGALAEDPVPGALVGELLFAGLKDQFERLRDGDPNYYGNILPPAAQFLLKTQKLSVVIARNTNLRLFRDLQLNAFKVP